MTTTTDTPTRCTDCDFCGEIAACHQYEGMARCYSCRGEHEATPRGFTLHGPDGVMWSDDPTARKGKRVWTFSG